MRLSNGQSHSGSRSIRVCSRTTKTYSRFSASRRSRGKKIVLATAADQLYAEAISAHLGVFSSIIASDSTRNLRGGVKADAIENHLAAEPFVYIGNDLSDLPIFERATGAILVEPPGALKRRVAASGKLLGVFPRQPKLRVFFRAVRLHQWSKNLLVFLPAIAGHQILDLDNLLVLVVSFFALSLMASSVYIFNDALDLSADRRHPTKCQRPLASGALSLRAGSLTVAAYLPAPVWLLLIAYVATSALYSFYLKRKRLVDILALVALYQLRLLIGHESARDPVFLLVHDVLWIHVHESSFSQAV